MKKEDVYGTSLFDLTHTQAAELLSAHRYPWEALPEIGAFIRKLGETLSETEYEKRGEDIWVHRSARVFPSAYLAGPCIVGPESEVRHCAFIRGSALIGAGCVVGNSTELKNVILFDGVQVPHYNYVGDSVLGYKAHMGAGSITSNVKSDKTLVKVHLPGEDLETGLKKFGAILGDHVEVGCGSVLNPGSVIGAGSSIYPLSSVREAVPANSIYKRQGEIAEKRGEGRIHEKSL